MPAQQPGEDAGHASVEDVVGGRFGSGEEDGEENDLDNVSQDGERQGCFHARAGRDADGGLAWWNGLRGIGHRESIEGVDRGTGNARAEGTWGEEAE